MCESVHPFGEHGLEILGESEKSAAVKMSTACTFDSSHLGIFSRERFLKHAKDVYQKVTCNKSEL